MDRNAAQDSLDIAHVSTFKLFKYMIKSYNLSPDDLSDRKPIDPKPFSFYFIRELIETANAHANYRFVIVDQANHNTKMLVWVLNWKCQTGAIDEKSGKVTFTSAIKLLYIPCNEDSQMYPNL